MREIIITANDAGRRLDRFLRKYLPGASLGEVYKIIRKDVRVDSKRRSESYMLNEGETLALYLSDSALASFGAPDPAGRRSGQGVRPRGRRQARRNFGIVYEDGNVLIADKPYGLLTHGDSREKKDHLANQVKDYLIAEGAYDPRNEKVFSPAPANRLDRNTTGLVLFGKTAAAMRGLNRMIREDEISKFYLTIACGEITEELHLSGSLTKDEASNRVTVTGPGQQVCTPGRKEIETIVRPVGLLRFGGGLCATFCEVELLTGRTHQIRAHLASAGHPLAGDSKYAERSSLGVNRYMRERFGLTTQLLHAARLEFAADAKDTEGLGYLAGRSFEAALPKRFSEILGKLK